MTDQPEKFWRAHFIVRKGKCPHLGDDYYETGLHEVHYEYGKPVGWTGNPMSISGHSFDSANESLEECRGLLSLYENAKHNVVFEEKTDWVKDEDGNEVEKHYLVPYTGHEKISYDMDKKQYSIDLSTDPENSSDIEIDIDDETRELIEKSSGYSFETPGAIHYLYDTLNDIINNIDDYIDDYIDVDDSKEDKNAEK